MGPRTALVFAMSEGRSHGRGQTRRASVRFDGRGARVGAGRPVTEAIGVFQAAECGCNPAGVVQEGEVILVDVRVSSGQNQ